MKKKQLITQDAWNLCNEFNKQIVDEFLENSHQLSKQSKNNYRTNLMIWFNWVRENLDNKSQLDIKPLEYLKFQTWLVTEGYSLSDITNKRAAVSSLCNYIEEYCADRFPQFKTCIAKGMRKPKNISKGN